MNQRNDSRTLRHSDERRSLAARGFAGLCGAYLAACAGAAWAGPEGGNVVTGTGTIDRVGNTTLITQGSQRLGIDWQSFDVGAGETVRFDQPNARAAALNRIFDQNPSQILGALDANGHVYLINPNGIVFGESANINVGALIASSLDISHEDFANGHLVFEQGDGAGGLVVNRGLIEAATGGSVSLIGGAVANEGLIVAELGQVNLGAGSRATLDFDGDGLLLFEIDESVLSNAAGVEAAVANSGEIRADGGQIVLTGRASRDVFSSVVNNDGVLRAASIDDSGGVVRLSGNDGSVVSNGTIDANGVGGGGGEIEVLAENVSIGAGAALTADADTVGDGGRVVVVAEDTATFDGAISARGGSAGGDGGFAEVSGYEHISITGHADLRAPAGDTGTWLIDPGLVTICDEDLGSCTPGGPDVFGDDSISAALDAANLTIQTQNASGGIENIVFEDSTIDISWATANTLTLIAGDSILLDGSVDAGAGVLDLQFGADGAGGLLDLNGVTLTGTVTASGGAGADTLAGNDIANAWDLTGAGAGSVTNANGTIDFTAVEDLSGGSAADDLTLNGGTLTGTFAGAGGTDSIEADTGANIFNVTGANTGNLTGVGAFTGVENLTGNSGGDTFSLNGGTLSGTVAGAGGADTLVGDNVANAFDITGANSGDATGVGAFTSIENLTGNAGGDTFNVNGGTLSGTAAGAGGSDEITVASASTFNVTGPTNAGNVTGSINAFTSIENLTGSGGADTFNFDAALLGTAVGGAGGDLFAVNTGGSVGLVDGGSGTDTQTYAGFGVAVTVAVSGLTNIETLVGSGNADTLQGTGGADAFTTSAADTGSVGGVNYSSFENLAGLGGNDTFNLGHTISGSIDGGAGTDTLVAATGGAHTFNVTAIDAGTLDGEAFSAVENLTGNAGADTFTFDAALSGTASGAAGNDLFALNTGGSANLIDGGAGTDTQTYASSAGPVTISVADLTNIETLIGSANVDTLEGTGGADTFSTTGPNAGTLAGVDYSAFENLAGLGGNDTFNLQHAVSGSVDAGADDDTVNLTAGVAVGTLTGGAGAGDSDTLAVLGGGARTWNVNATDSGTVAGQVFSEFENLVGDGVVDTFEIDSTLTFTVFGGGGDDVFNVNVGGSLGGSDGGAGTDTLSYSAFGADVTVSLPNLVSIESLVGSAGANDSLQGSTGADTFTTTGADAGTTGDISYTGFENLLGVGGDDQFTIAHSVSGLVDGGAGSDTTTLSSGVSVGTLTGGAAGADSDTLAFTGGAATFTMTGTDAGTVNGQAFAEFENLQGSSSADTFNLAFDLTGTAQGMGGNDVFNLSANVSAQIAGGGGTLDEILADAATATTFDVTGADAGSITNGTGTVGFATVENLSGSGQADTFNFDASLSGTASGGAGNDVFNLMASIAGSAAGGTGNDSFNVAAGIDASVDGEGGTDTLQASGTATTFNVSGANAGSAASGGGTVSFAGLEALIGGAAADTFTLLADFAGTLAGGAGDDLFDIAANLATAMTGEGGNDRFELADGVSATGALDGGAGNDVLDLSASSTPRTVTLSGAGATDGFDGSADGVSSFLNTNLVVGSDAAGDGLNSADGDADWSLSDAGDSYSNGSQTLAFTGFEALNGGTGADVFTLGAGARTGNLTLAGGAGDDAAMVMGNFTLDGDLNLGAIESVRSPGGAVLGANALVVDGATGGIGEAGAPLVVALDTIEVMNGGTSLVLADANALEVTWADVGEGEVDITVGDGDLVVGFINAGGAGAALDVPAAGTGGDVVLTAAGGSILSGNIAPAATVRGRTATLSAFFNIGSAARPITITVPSNETITLAAIDANINNVSLATVDDSFVTGIFSDLTQNATAAAVGASTVSALQDVSAIDWAGLDPNVTLVDCLEPCVALPEDQLEDDGFAMLRDATKMLLIRTSEGFKLIPVFVRETIATVR